jgi:5,10-methenyltetrahydrofolate synthetase
VFREWWPGVAMTKRVFDLPVPDGTAVVQPQALLIPLVGFDERGFRLGYGGGYFDRTLAAQAIQPLRIGIGFELSRMPTIHPQPHDVAMDFIVTEAGIYSVGTSGLERIDAAECAHRAQALFDERFSAE